MNSIKSLKITTLAENLVMGKGLGQWGLSLLLDLKDPNGKERKIMLDTATKPKGLFHNIKQLETDLTDLDCIVLSHNHYDHTSSTVQVVEATGGVKIYAHTDLFNPHIRKDNKGKTRDIGVPEDQGISKIESAGGEVILNNKPTEIVPGIWTTGEVPRKTFETPMELREEHQLLTKTQGEWINDQISDDQSLWMHLDNFGAIVTTGCAHAGPLNILNHVKILGGFKDIQGLIGGTHLVGRKDKYLKQSIKGLKEYNLKVFSPCHCTGFKAASELWRNFPNEFILNYCLREINPSNPPENKII